DHLAGALAVCEDACARRRRRAGGCKAEHAALDGAAIVRACDDLLAGVAAFFEADRADEIEIEHLCDERLVRRRVYLRETGANMLQPPEPFLLRGGRRPV